MERIERALEIARAQRTGMPEPGARVMPLPTPKEARTCDQSVPAGFPSVPLDRIACARSRIVFPEERSPAAHAYRMLRAQLLAQIRGSTSRVVGVVSGGDAEGKSLTAVNLALSLASEPSQHVVLVDLDIRRPSISGLLGMPSRPGVEAYLAGRLSFEQLPVGLAGIERLLVVPCAAAVPVGDDALSGSLTQQLIERLRDTSGQPLLVVDIAPALLSADVFALAPLIDSFLIVATEGRTRRDDLARLQQLMRPMHVVGTVLNMASDFEKRAY